MNSESLAANKPGTRLEGVPTEVDGILSDTWNLMVAKPDSGLVDLLTRRLLEQTGITPTEGEVQQFLSDRLEQISV